jgi:nickel-dependent lactate racemase
MTISVGLAYGLHGLTVDLPADRTTVIEPRFTKGLEDEEGALREGLRNPIGVSPLKRLVNQTSRVAISICDATRAIPTRRILPVILEELGHLSSSNITILVATGTHRGSSDAELDRMVGPEIGSRYEILDHNCQSDDELEWLGRTDRGTPIWLNRRWQEADVRITVGFVEPHFFAGFSGGPKLVAPGLAGLETVMALHSAELIADPFSTFGEIEQNPIHSEVREIAVRSGVTFSVDVSINRDREITGVYAGDLFAAHARACREVKTSAMQPVSEPFDIVLTTNSGYPLDLNLYQSVKGMAAASRIVREGGTIICAAECSDGLPDHGSYGEILGACGSPQEILDMVMSPGYSRQDQWQAQIQAQIQLRANLYVKADGLSDDQLERAHVKPVHNVEVLVNEELERLGPTARICVLPEGPQTIPYLD